MTSTHKPTLFLTLALYLLMIGSLSAKDDDKRGFNFKTVKTSHVTIPFKLIDNLIVIEAYIGGNQKINLMVDTGVRSVLLVNKRKIKKMGMAFGKTLTFTGVGIGESMVGKTILDFHLDLPGINGRYLSALALERDYLGLSLLGIDGIIGYQLFTRFIVKIDYLNQELVFYEPALFVAPASKALPITIDDTKPYTTAMVSGANGPEARDLLIDTGCALALILPESNSTIAAFTQAKGFGGLLKGKNVVIDNLSLGTMEFKKVDALVAEKLHEDKQNYGIIGGAILRNYVITLDYFQGRLFIERS